MDKATLSKNINPVPKGNIFKKWPGRQALQDKLNSSGYLLLENAFSDYEMHMLRDEIEKIFKIARPGKESIHELAQSLDQLDKTTLHQIYSAIEHSSKLINFQKKLSEIVSDLINDANPIIYVGGVVLFGLPQDKRLTYDWHQETGYYPGVSDRIFNFWFPIFESATADNGAMSVLEGSHTLDKLNYKKVSRDTGYTNLIPAEIQKITAKYNEHWCLCDPGTLVMFDGNLIHRSNWNHTSRTRFSGVMRFISMTEIPERLVFSPDLY